MNRQARLLIILGAFGMAAAAGHPRAATAANGTLGELKREAGVESLPKVEIPPTMAAYVDVPVYGEDYSTNLVQPLYELRATLKGLRKDIDEASRPGALLSCRGTRWPQTALCESHLGDIEGLLRKYVKSQSLLARHTDRLLALKEVERLSTEGRQVVKSFYDEALKTTLQETFSLNVRERSHNKKSLTNIRALENNVASLNEAVAKAVRAYYEAP